MVWIVMGHLHQKVWSVSHREKCHTLDQQCSSGRSLDESAASCSMTSAGVKLLSCTSSCDLGVFLFYVAKLTNHCYILEPDLSDELQAYIIGYYLIFQKNLKVNVSGTKFNTCLPQNIFLYSVSQLTMPASAHLFKTYIIREASSLICNMKYSTLSQLNNSWIHLLEFTPIAILCFFFSSTLTTEILCYIQHAYFVLHH